MFNIFKSINARIDAYARDREIKVRRDQIEFDTEFIKTRANERLNENLTKLAQDYEAEKLRLNQQHEMNLLRSRQHLDQNELWFINNPKVD